MTKKCIFCVASAMVGWWFHQNKQPYTRSALRGYKEVAMDGPAQEKKKLQVKGVDPYWVEVIKNEIHVK